jgi:hypothetical protein
MKIKEQKKLFQQAREIEIAKENESIMVLATVNHVPAFYLKGEMKEVVHALVSACVDAEGFVDVLKMAVDVYENSGIAEELKSKLYRIRNAN